MNVENLSHSLQLGQGLLCIKQPATLMPVPLGLNKLGSEKAQNLHRL
jgi:hypothetical protein